MSALPAAVEGCFQCGAEIPGEIRFTRTTRTGPRPLCEACGLQREADRAAVAECPACGDEVTLLEVKDGGPCVECLVDDHQEWMRERAGAL